MLLAFATLAADAARAESDGEAGEEPLLSRVRQMTFEGRRAGEGYFNPDASRMIFQSEREPGNPFYQIYLMDLATGDVRRVSTGVGKTTCAWIHPGDDKVLFASTHEDPDAVGKQEEELAKRAEGKSRGYAWSFDEYYEIYEVDLATGDFTNLTRAPGYDAEGSWSPDGTKIAFASNRHAYAEPLTKEERGILERDPSYFMDLYIMDADGGNLRRLTDVPGYDGGPFFSADGKRIVWRRFAPDGATAEIFTMNVDGSGERQMTRLGAMSWAPFFPPSGDYIVFTTNLHGFGNFELYLVAADGGGKPVRVTYTDGFDGLPAFTPDGRRLAWASSRTRDKTTQIFFADWNDKEALRLLGLAAGPRGEGETAAVTPLPGSPATDPAIRADDIHGHVAILASDEMEGRLTGTEGERRATAYVAGTFRGIGLAPAGDPGSYFQEFEFMAGVALGPGNRFALLRGEGEAGTDLALDRAWRPLAFSKTGAVPASEVAFAGYGIVAPAASGFAALDSYGDLDVAGKWVLVLRHLPRGVDGKYREYLRRFADLQYKASVVRDRGARGLLVASGPAARVRDGLVPLAHEAGVATAGIAALSVADTVAEELLAAAGRSLGDVQAALDAAEPVLGFAVPGVRLSATIDVLQEKRRGRNVIGRLAAGDAPGDTLVVVGAHVDHLGRGLAGKSLARAGEEGEIHPGADDNASGVAGMFEIAEFLASEKAKGRLPLRRDVLFAAWSGEELGVLGSTHFADTFGGGGRESLRPEVVAYLNLDMIGRLEDTLVLLGVGSSPVWRREIERRNVPLGLPITTSEEAYLPSDALPFYLKGVPILSALSAVHTDHHTPRDTPEKLDYEGAERIARLMGGIARSLATSAETPAYVRVAGPGERARRRTSEVYLGTIPDYARSGETGLRLSGVASGGPAEAAGLQAGDVVVELGGKAVANIYDYSYALDGLRIGEAVPIVVEREGNRVTLTITPAARE